MKICLILMKNDDNLTDFRRFDDNLMKGKQYLMKLHEIFDNLMTD